MQLIGEMKRSGSSRGESEREVDENVRYLIEEMKRSGRVTVFIAKASIKLLCLCSVYHRKFIEHFRTFMISSSMFYEHPEWTTLPRVTVNTRVIRGRSIKYNIITRSRNHTWEL